MQISLSLSLSISLSLSLSLVVAAVPVVVVARRLFLSFFRSVFRPRGGEPEGPRRGTRVPANFEKLSKVCLYVGLSIKTEKWIFVTFQKHRLYVRRESMGGVESVADAPNGRRESAK